MRKGRLALLAVVGTVAVAAVPAQSPASARVPAAPTVERAWLARVVFPTWVRTRPAGGAPRVMLLQTTSSWARGPEQLLVLDKSYDRRGRLWLHVRLPIRPNNAAGWIDADNVSLSTTAWRIVVRIGARTVSLYRAGQLVRRVSAVVGAPGTPTPSGFFAVAERAAQPDPAGFLGPWALHLTAHSDVLEDFGGGPGTIGLHGRGGASLDDPLGTARSHGCIRIDNSTVTLLARVAREGTPVLVAP
jgi:hypothetical protein